MQRPATRIFGWHAAFWGIVGLSVSTAALSDSVFYLGDTITATGTGAGQTLNTITPSPANPSNGTISPTVSYTLGNSFNESGGVTTGSNFNLSGGPWNFQDDFYFSTTGATIQTVVISNLFANVSGLQVRLIQAAGNGPPTIGPPSGGTLVDSWQSFNLGSGGSYNETLPTGFAAGSYIMQIRGEAGSAASYSGTISFTPVPVPAAAGLLLSGLGVIWVFRSGRKIMATETDSVLESSPQKRDLETRGAGG
jgi:hypothetical protein